MIEVRWFKNLIVLLVCVNLSGVHTLAQAAQPDLVSITQASAQLDEKAQELAMRAKHHGRPGVAGGAPTEGELKSFEAKLLDWKSKLEVALALPNTPSGDEAYLPIDAKLEAINLYLNHLHALVIVRISMHQPRGANWRKAFAIAVPKKIAGDFPSIGAASKNRLGDRFYPFSRTEKNGIFFYNLSQSTVNGLELGRHADDPNSKNFLTMMQYMTIRQLLQNLAEVTTLKTDHQAPQITLPASFTDKLQSMQGVNELLSEQLLAIEEPSSRVGLVDTHQVPIDGSPKFVDDKLVTAILGQMVLAYPKGKRAGVKKKAFPLLKAALEEAEKASLEMPLEEDVLAVPGFVSKDRFEELAPSLRFLLANAKGTVIIEHLARVLTSSAPSYVPEAARYKILRLIEDRRQKFQESITDKAIQDWLIEAKKSASGLLYDKRKTEFTQDLLVKSSEISQGVRTVHLKTPADPSILARVLAPDLYELSLRGSTQSWILESARAGSYVAARDKYAEIMARVTDPYVLRNGLVNPAMVEHFVETHDFWPDLEFSKKVNQQLAVDLIKDVIDSRQKDIRDFAEFGRRMGFHKIQFRRDAPLVSEILTTEKAIDRYFEMLKKDMIEKHHLLSAKVIGQRSDGDWEEMPLYQALHALNPHGTTGPVIEAEASHLIDQALASTERTILKKIDEVARATKLGKIEEIASSSVMTELLIQGFPEYKREKDEFLERLLTPDMTDQFMHRYVSKYVSYGFGALLLGHIARGISKRKWLRRTPYIANTSFSEAMLAAADPMVQAYMKSAVFFIVADTVYQYNELIHVKNKRDERRDYFSSSATGLNFFQQSDVKEASKAYTWAKWIFIGRAALDGPFMYYPAVRGVLTKLGTRLNQREITADARAFNDLALRPGAWNELDQALSAVRASEDMIGTELVKRAERAYVRLNGKVKSGETWDIEAASNPELASQFLSKADQKLRTFLIESMKAAK